MRNRWYIKDVNGEILGIYFADTEEDALKQLSTSAPKEHNNIVTKIIMDYGDPYIAHRQE